MLQEVRPITYTTNNFKMKIAHRVHIHSCLIGINDISSENVPLYRCYRCSPKQNQDDLKEFLPQMIDHTTALLLLCWAKGRLTWNALWGTELLEYRHPILTQQHDDLARKAIPVHDKFNKKIRPLFIPGKSHHKIYVDSKQSTEEKEKLKWKQYTYTQLGRLFETSY